MNYKAIFINIFLYTSALPLYSQRLIADAPDFDAFADRKNDFTIQVPDSLDKLKFNSIESFSSTEHLRWWQGITEIAESKERDFRIFLYAMDRMTPEDSIEFDKTRAIVKVIKFAKHLGSPDEICEENIQPAINVRHMNKMRNDLALILNAKWEPGSVITPEEFKQYITYLPNEYAREKFNADSAATYNSWPKYEEKAFEGKYIGSQALMLQSNSKGYVILYIFYTENGKERLWDFMKEIEGIIWFKD